MLELHALRSEALHAQICAVLWCICGAFIRLPAWGAWMIWGIELYSKALTMTNAVSHARETRGPHTLESSLDQLSWPNLEIHQVP